MMSMMSMTRTTSIAVLVATAALTLADRALAQPVSRLKGRVVTERGEPIEGATVRAEAIYGFAAGDYVGQRMYEARTNAKGEWSIVGFRAGVWLFDAAAPDRLPETVALPINLVTAIGSGASGLMLTWQLVLKNAEMPKSDLGRTLAETMAAARADQSDRVRLLLNSVSDEAGADGLAAAGRIALLVRDAGLARSFFLRAFDRDPASFRAALGVASTSLMQRDFDTASRAFSSARDRTRDKDEQKYLSAAIGDLSKIVVPAR